ncbi:hypothetical protein HNQ94_001188 [Salirhabdus euzebyi]|uniref:HD domain-containing protein n=1 Tax=Salirhabdus euzebyi TaxID=394506 RepID=A0A841Q2E5_9BACI|nr:HD domain-containing protein [Salirhabdus euzebyi]MBB6452742.1 hypothetical protein [Salirhabdus euzebyi]
MIYVFDKENTTIHEPFYQTSIQAHPWELALLQSKAVKRLKFLSHYGTGSFITLAKHSRFEHTVGVWAIIATHFPREDELRIAALLHDIGHLPFSHAVEKTLGFNHHTITEEYIRGEEITTILQSHGFTSERIIHLLDNDSALSHKTDFLSADHLDSFVRDAYMLGKCKVHPAKLLQNISFHQQYVEADLETSKAIMNAIYYDHTCFLNPITLGLDALLAQAISIFASNKEVQLESIKSLTNNELLQLLKESNVKEVEKILNVILWNPHKVKVYDDEIEGGLKVDVRKVYDKTPLVNGTALTSICSESEKLLYSIRALKKEYYITY